MRLATATIVLLAACAPDRQPEERLNLDRPSAITFTCFGDLRITDGEEPSEDQPIVRSAQPLTSCQTWAAADPENPVPEGQGVVGDRGPHAPAFGGFVLQPSEGTVAVVSYGTDPAGGQVAAVVDSDPLAPGKNSIPIGLLPVDLATTATGCHVVTANAGSCDLSVLDVNTALDTRVTPEISRLQVYNASGDPITALPHAIAAEPPGGPIGVECPATATGIMYVAYPECHLVAAVDVATGEVVAGIRFDEDGTPELTDGDVSCEAACGGGRTPRIFDDGIDLTAGNFSGMSSAATRSYGSDESMMLGEGLDAGPDGGPDAGMADAGAPDAGMPDGGSPDGGMPPVGAGAPHPVTLHMATIDVPVSGQDPVPVTRLFIGALDSPRITVVDVDDDYLPTSVRQVELEGDVGVRRLQASPLVDVGGSSGELGAGTAGRYQYVYAIATDHSIRVAEVHDLGTECDAAVDPRYLHEVRDVSFLACMPVGDVRTPPRRAGARSPGIVLPADNGDGRPHPAPLPLDVAFAEVAMRDDPESGGEPHPFNIVGAFAFVTASNGRTYFITVDDDNYPDFESSTAPTDVWMTLAVPHQPRDLIRERNAVSVNGDNERLCSFPSADPSRLGPRVSSLTVRGVPSGTVAEEKAHLLPYLRDLYCEGADSSGTAVPELSFQAPEEVRERAFPDLRAVPSSEGWTLTWEGPVSRDGSSVNVDGPPVRVGYVEVPGGESFTLEDAGAPFCRMGIEDYDIAVLRGCDAARGNADCGTGESCMVHPDSPESGVRGMCLPADRASELAGPCRDLMVSRRRYTVEQTFDDRLVLGVRRRALTTTPPAGCQDTSHCEDLYQIEREIRVPDHPVDLDLPEPEADYTWSCEPDPTRAPGPDQCVMTCDVSADCEAGWTCSGGYCVEGPLPPAVCVSGPQRYEVRVGQAFAAIGSQTGFLHDRIVDPETGMCMADPDASPLLTGRVPLAAPPCEGDGITSLEPNPCSTVVEHAEEREIIADDGACRELNNPEIRVRETEAIRFRNPLFTFHLVDPVTEGDAVCRQDRAGTGIEFSTAFPGFQLAFSLTGGFFGMYAPEINAAFPAAIANGPTGDLWILDQGDAVVSGFGRLRGQMFRLDPSSLARSLLR